MAGELRLRGTVGSSRQALECGAFPDRKLSRGLGESAAGKTEPLKTPAS